MSKKQYLKWLVMPIVVSVLFFLVRTPTPPSKEEIKTQIETDLRKELYIDALDRLATYETSQEDVEWLLLKAQAYEGLRQLDEVIAVYERIVDKFPQEKRAYEALLKHYKDEYPKKYVYTLYRMKRAFPHEDYKALQEYVLGYEKQYLPIDFIANSESEFYIFQKGKKFGIMDSALDVMVEAEFDKLYDYSEDTHYFGAIKDGKAFYIDSNGYKRQVSDAHYEEVGYQSEGKSFAKRDGKFGYIDYEFKELTPFSYDDATSFYKSIAAVKKDGKWRFINDKFEKMSDTLYDTIMMNRNKIMNEFGVIWAKKDNKWVLLDEQLKEIAIPYVKQVKRFASTAPTAVELENGWGFLTIKGTVLNNQRFLDAQPFYNGKAFVKNKKNQWVLISENFEFGKTVLAKNVSVIHSSGVAKVVDLDNQSYFVKINPNLEEVE